MKIVIMILYLYENENRIYFNVYSTMKSSVIVYSYLLSNLVYLDENTGKIISNIRYYHSISIIIRNIC